MASDHWLRISSAPAGTLFMCIRLKKEAQNTDRHGWAAEHCPHNSLPRFRIDDEVYEEHMRSGLQQTSRRLPCCMARRFSLHNSCDRAESTSCMGARTPSSLALSTSRAAWHWSKGPIRMTGSGGSPLQPPASTVSTMCRPPQRGPDPKRPAHHQHC